MADPDPGAPDLGVYVATIQGDYARVTARLLAVGRTSRKRSYEAHVVARHHGIGTQPFHGAVLDEPILIARATGTTVTPIDKQPLTPTAVRFGCGHVLRGAPAARSSALSGFLGLFEGHRWP